MITLYDKDTGTKVGSITEAQLQFLADQLEEEFPEDSDYYINSETIDLLEERGADTALVQLLRAGLGEREGMEVRWSAR